MDDMGPGPVLEDVLLEDVRRVWLTITGGTEAEFMKFEARTGTEDGDGEQEASS